MLSHSGRSGLVVGKIVGVSGAAWLSAPEWADFPAASAGPRSWGVWGLAGIGYTV